MKNIVSNDSLFSIFNRDCKKDKIILMNPKIPCRTSAILGNGENPTSYIAEGVACLEFLGADYTVIPCNTAHFFIKNIPFKKKNLNMISEVAKTAKNYNLKKVGLLATAGTYKSDIYKSVFSDFSIDILYPDSQEQIDQITKGIFLIKSGNTSYEVKKIFLSAINNFFKNKLDSIILGCTEIPIVINEKYFCDGKIKVLNSTEILAESVKKTNGIVGILGGLGPSATVEFIKKIDNTPISKIINILTIMKKAKTDQEHNQYICFDKNKIFVKNLQKCISLNKKMRFAFSQNILNKNIFSYLTDNKNYFILNKKSDINFLANDIFNEFCIN